eukprot:Lankesteria_metandrocarpae@DN1921_c0_g1_i1.p1
MGNCACPGKTALAEGEILFDESEQTLTINTNNAVYQFDSVAPEAGGEVLSVQPRGSSAEGAARTANTPPKKDGSSDGAIVCKAVTFDNGAIYQGWWRGDLREGYGIQVWADGACYDGQWKDDKAHGKGRFQHIDGDVYYGDWHEDKADGYGVYKHADGSSYEGEWCRDKRHGLGTENWPDGAAYTGQYADGRKTGRGRFCWKDGSVYEGGFSSNDINGKGTYWWMDGRVYSGDWLCNRMHGRGEFEWPDGRCYKGDYENDKKHGQGVFTWPDGRVYSGGWREGRQHGEGTFTSHGETCRGQWLNGKRIRWLDPLEELDPTALKSTVDAVQGKDHSLRGSNDSATAAAVHHSSRNTGTIKSRDEEFTKHDTATASSTPVLA